MRYYSEETVKRMLLRVAHTALEQRAINNGDVFFRQPSIELPDNHGNLKDEQTILNEMELRFGKVHSLGYVSDIVQDMESVIMAVPTVVESTE